MKELLDSSLPLNQNKAVQILRNKEGAGNKNIGLGNPKSLNQLIAHHSVVFKPKQMKMWISTSPYQLGGFICYDLREAFKKNGQYIVDSLTIKEDAFLQDERYKKYEQFKNTKQKIKKFVLFNIPFSLDTTAETAFIQANPDSYITYMELGDYYKKIKKYEKANTYYLQALDHDVASVNETEVLKKNISVCKKNQSK
jgi:tetratricopeptide (TPR) repeat protein